MNQRTVWEDDRQLEPDPKTFYSTDAINDYALRFLEQQRGRDKPFFLYLAHIAPHFPLQARFEDIAKYRGRYREGFEVIRRRRYEQQKKLGIVGKAEPLSGVDERVRQWDQLSEDQKDTFDLRMAVYAAQIDCLDRGIGRVVEKLKAIGQLDNTVIFFLSDNGGTHEQLKPLPLADRSIGTPKSWTSYEPSWANVSNTPFRMYKHWMYEGGISTPLIVHYPAWIKKQRRDGQVGHIIDLMPTCLELAGVSYPASRREQSLLPLAGRSLVPILKGKQRPQPEFLGWEHEGNRAVRQGDWKLVSSYPNNTWELYNLRTDRTEQHDVSREHPDRVRAMEEQYGQWAKRVGVVPWQQLTANKN